jgi:signal transduction histidine kinase
MSTLQDAPVKTIADLMTSALHVEESAPISRVVQIWETHPGEDGMAVLGGNHVRYVSRPRFFHQLGKRFGYALFENRPISLLAEEASIVEAEREPVEVIALATQREPSRIYDDIVVLDEGRFLGLVSVRSLLVHHKSLLANGIAERVLLEDRNRQLQEMNHAQAEFMAAVTQQLRSPVNTMLGVMQALAADPDTRARHAGSLGALLARGQELLAMVADLQDLAKLERGELVPIFESFDPTPVLEEAAAAARPFLAGRTLRLETSLGGLPRGFVTDALFLRRIAYNLLGTAIALTPEGTVTLGGEASGPALSIWVGGPATDLGEVETNRGSGLQLAAARALAERLGGTLEMARRGASPSLCLSLPPGRA